MILIVKYYNEIVNYYLLEHFKKFISIKNIYKYYIKFINRINIII